MKKGINVIENLPSNKANLLARGNGANKTLIISLISIGIIAVLYLLLFYKPGFVGKAYTSTVNTAGIEQIAPVSPYTPFSITIKANIGSSQTVALDFVLILPSGVTCDMVKWGVL